MAKLTPAAELIAGLQAQGWSYADIAKSLNVNRSLIRQAVNPSPGQRQKPLTKYVPALTQLQGQKPGAKPAQLPPRRTTKSGGKAAVRVGIKDVKTRQGKTHQVARGKRAPATMRKAIERAAREKKDLKFDVNFKKAKTKSDKNKQNVWATGHMNAADLLDRIDHPEAARGETWQPGDVRAAMKIIVLAQNESSIISATGAQDYGLYTIE